MEDFEQKHKELIDLKVLKVSNNVDISIDINEPNVIDIIAFDGLYKKRFYRKERVNVTNKIKLARQDAINLGFKSCDDFLLIKEK